MEIEINKSLETLTQDDWNAACKEVSEILKIDYHRMNIGSYTIDNCFHFYLPNFTSLKYYKQNNYDISVNHYSTSFLIGKLEFLNDSIKIFIDETLFDDIKIKIKDYDKQTQLCNNIWVVKKLVVESILKGNGFSKKKEHGFNFTHNQLCHTHTYTCCNKTFYLYVSRDNILNSNEDDFILRCVDGYDLKISQIQNSNFKDKLKELMSNLNKEQNSLAEIIETAESKSASRIEKLKSDFVNSF